MKPKPASPILLAFIFCIAGWSVCDADSLKTEHGTRAEITEKGTWRIFKGDTVVIEKIEVGAWEEGDAYIGQEDSRPPRIESKENIRRMTGSLGSEVLSYEMDVTSCGKGIFFSVTQTGSSENTWAVLLDLPLELFNGTNFVLDGKRAKSFPADAPETPRFFTGNAESLLTAQTQDVRLLVDCGKRHGMVVQDARSWGKNAYQILIYPKEGKVSFLLSLSSTKGRPEILSVSRSNGDVGLYGRCELDVSLWGKYANPYDEEDVSVTADFVSPSGGSSSVQGFLFREFLRDVTDGKETYEAAGEPLWKIRFSPEEVGRYEYSVKAKTKNGESSTAKGAFKAVPSERDGFIRAVGTHFEYDSGRPYFAIGHNVCWTPDESTVSEYEKYFSKMSRAGENFSRIWLCSWGIGLETASLDELNLEDAWKLDQVLSLAEKNGIYLKLCFENFWDFTKKKQSPYWAANGGFCSNGKDFFSKPKAREWAKRKYRYAVARWGYSPNILAWELWNEVDYALNDKKLRLEWTVEMSDYIGSMDPHDHLVTTSLGVSNVWPELWQMPQMDFVQIHSYIRRMGGFLSRSELDAAKMVRNDISRIAEFGKPFLIAEYGYLVTEQDQGMNSVDTTGIHLHNGLWASALSGSAGTCMSWWWDVYIEKYDLYYHLKNLSLFLEGEEEWMTTLKSVVGESPSFRVLGLKGDEGGLFWMQNRQNTWYNCAAKKQKRMSLKGSELKLSDLIPGRYLVQWWDTHNGGVITEHEVEVGDDGILEAKPPSSASDIGCKVKLLRTPEGNND